MKREPPPLMIVLKRPSRDDTDTDASARMWHARRNADLTRARAKAAGADIKQLNAALSKLRSTDPSVGPDRIAQLARAVAREADRLVALRRLRALEEMLVENDEAHWIGA